MAKHTENAAPREAAKGGKKWLRTVGIAAGSLAAVLVIGYVVCCAMVDQETVLGHFVVNGVDLKGMTRQEAAAALEAECQADYGEAAISVEANGDVYEVSVADALSLDAEQGVERAFARGHGGFLSRGLALIQAQWQVESCELLPQVTDREALEAAVAASGLLEIDTTVQTGYEVTEEALVFTKGVTGASVEESGLLSLLEEAVNQGDYTSVVECPMLTGKVEAVDLQALYDEVYVAPENATLDPEQGYAVVESVTGVSFDIMTAQTLLDTSAEGSTIEVPLTYTEPEITTELLEKNLFKDVLGTYTTTVGGTNDRKNNVKLAAQKCNGVILMPGETFSYNDVVGKRTTQAGYKAASAYMNGEVVQSIGGGICQVSSTLYNATLLANLEITERRNHTYESSYVPLGLDATVSWGGPDYKFTNNTDYPIKITTSYSSSNRLTCTIYGTDQTGYKVKMTSETLSVIPYNTIEEKTSTLYEGETKVKTSGENGYKVQTYRKVYDANGNLISSTKEAYSVYSKMDRVVLVGTKKRPVQEEPPAEETPAEETPAEETPAEAGEGGGTSSQENSSAEEQPAPETDGAEG